MGRVDAQVIPEAELALIVRHDTPDEQAGRTEICWPTFSTGPA